MYGTIDQHRDDWTYIADAGPVSRAYLRPTWYDAWAKAYSAQGNWSPPVRTITVDDGNGNGSAFPYAVQKIGPFRFASLCGGYFPSRGIPFCGDAQKVAVLLGRAFSGIKGVSGIRLGPVQDDDILLRALEPALRQMGWKWLTEEVGTEHVLDNPGGLEAFEAVRSKSRLKKIEQLWRGLCRNGPTELRHYNGVDTDWPQVFSDAAAVENAAWVSQRGETRFLGAENQLYWNSLAQDPWFAKALHMWLVYHEEKPVSFVLAIDSVDTRYLYANSYDEAVAKYSTGAKIYSEIMRDAFGNDIGRVNIGLGDSGYKASWGAVMGANLVDIIVFPPTIGGRLAYWVGRGHRAYSLWRKNRAQR